MQGVVPDGRKAEPGFNPPVGESGRWGEANRPRLFGRGEAEGVHQTPRGAYSSGSVVKSSG
jgi:hypothetical protein